MSLSTSNDSEIVLDLGLQPVSNRFIGEVPFFPMQLGVFRRTGLLHLATPFPIEEVTPRVSWLAYNEPEEHLDDLVLAITRLPNISHCSVLGGYSYKDDSTLRRLRDRGYVNITSNKMDLVDVLIVRHVLEHNANMVRFVGNLKLRLKPNGYIIFEVPDCKRAIENGDATFVWEEHLAYFSEATFKNFVRSQRLSIVEYASVLYPLENCIIAIAKDCDIGHVHHDGNIDEELNLARKLASKHDVRRQIICESIRKRINLGGEVVLCGAGHFSVSFVSLYGLQDLISCVIDDNSNKIGLKLPGTNLEIMGSDYLKSGRVTSCLLGFNPLGHARFIERHATASLSRDRFISIFQPNEDWIC